MSIIFERAAVQWRRRAAPQNIVLASLEHVSADKSVIITITVRNVLFGLFPSIDVVFTVL